MSEQMKELQGIDYSTICNRIYALEQRCVYLESELRLVKEKLVLSVQNKGVHL